MTSDTQPVSERDVERFLDGVAKLHKLPGLRGAANARMIIENGFATTHMIGAMTKEDLKEVGFVLAYAKVLDWSSTLVAEINCRCSLVVVVHRQSP